MLAVSFVLDPETKPIENHWCIYLASALCSQTLSLWLFSRSVTAGKVQMPMCFLSLPFSLHFPLCALLRLSQESGPTTAVLSYQPGERERKREERESPGYS